VEKIEGQINIDIHFQFMWYNHFKGNNTEHR